MDKLYDYNSGICLKGVFEQVATHADAKLGYFVIDDVRCHMDGDRVAVIFYAENAYFTADNWQECQPDMTNMDEIQEYSWSFVDGTTGIMLNGLPKVGFHHIGYFNPENLECTLCGTTHNVSEVFLSDEWESGLVGLIKLYDESDITANDEAAICDDCLHANFTQCTICETHFRNEEFSHLLKQRGKLFCLFCSPQSFVDSCTNLQELCDTLNLIDELQVNQQLIDYASLPTFNSSVPDPHNTSEVFSWDDNQYLVQCQNWEVKERCPRCGEASFHCKCSE